MPATSLVAVPYRAIRARAGAARPLDLRHQSVRPVANAECSSISSGEAPRRLAPNAICCEHGDRGHTNCVTPPSSGNSVLGLLFALEIRHGHDLVRLPQEGLGRLSRSTADRPEPRARRIYRAMYRNSHLIGAHMHKPPNLPERGKPKSGSSKPWSESAGLRAFPSTLGVRCRASSIRGTRESGNRLGGFVPTLIFVSSIRVSRRWLDSGDRKGPTSGVQVPIAAPGCRNDYARARMRQRRRPFGEGVSTTRPQ